MEDNVEGPVAEKVRKRSEAGIPEDNGGREPEQKNDGDNFGRGGKGGGGVEGGDYGVGEEEEEGQGNKMARSFMRQAIWHTGLSSNFSCTKYVKTLIIR